MRVNLNGILKAKDYIGIGHAQHNFLILGTISNTEGEGALGFEPLQRRFVKIKDGQVYALAFDRVYGLVLEAISDLLDSWKEIKEVMASCDNERLRDFYLNKVMVELEDGCVEATVIVKAILATAVSPKTTLNLLHCMGLKGYDIHIAYAKHCGSNYEKFYDSIHALDPEMIQTVNRINPRFDRTKFDRIKRGKNESCILTS